MLFISYKKLFYIFLFPLFPSVSHYSGRWFKLNFKVYDVISCVNKNLKTHFIWNLKKEGRSGIETWIIDRVLDKEHFYGKIMQKKLAPDPFLILVNNPKTANAFKRLIWK